MRNSENWRSALQCLSKQSHHWPLGLLENELNSSLGQYVGTWKVFYLLRQPESVWDHGAVKLALIPEKAAIQKKEGQNPGYQSWTESQHT